MMIRRKCRIVIVIGILALSLLLITTLISSNYYWSNDNYDDSYHYSPNLPLVAWENDPGLDPQYSAFPQTKEYFFSGKVKTRGMGAIGWAYLYNL